jgi:hypothetical protein
VRNYLLDLALRFCGIGLGFLSCTFSGAVGDVRHLFLALESASPREPNQETSPSTAAPAVAAVAAMKPTGVKVSFNH